MVGTTRGQGIVRVVVIVVVVVVIYNDICCCLSYLRRILRLVALSPPVLP